MLCSKTLLLLCNTTTGDGNSYNAVTLKTRHVTQHEWRCEVVIWFLSANVKIKAGLWKSFTLKNYISTELMRIPKRPLTNFSVRCTRICVRTIRVCEQLIVKQLTSILVLCVHHWAWGGLCLSPLFDRWVVFFEPLGIFATEHVREVVRSIAGALACHEACVSVMVVCCSGAIAILSFAWLGFVQQRLFSFFAFYEVSLSSDKR